jgi:hypothetical protein
MQEGGGELGTSDDFVPFPPSYSDAARPPADAPPASLSSLPERRRPRRPLPVPVFDVDGGGAPATKTEDAGRVSLAEVRRPHSPPADPLVKAEEAQVVFVEIDDGSSSDGREDRSGEPRPRKRPRPPKEEDADEPSVIELSEDDDAVVELPVASSKSTLNSTWTSMASSVLSRQRMFAPLYFPEGSVRPGSEPLPPLRRPAPRSLPLAPMRPYDAREMVLNPAPSACGIVPPTAVPGTTHPPSRWRFDLSAPVELPRMNFDILFRAPNPLQPPPHRKTYRAPGRSFQRGSLSDRASGHDRVSSAGPRKSRAPTKPQTFLFAPHVGFRPNRKGVLPFMALLKHGLPLRTSGSHSQIQPFFAEKKISVLLLVDCDNCFGTLHREGRRIPEDVFVWCFHGGTERGGLRDLPSWRDAIEHRRLAITLCGDGRNSADFAITFFIAELHRAVPPSVTFVIVSGDNDLRRAALYVQDRRVVYWKPRRRPLLDVRGFLETNMAASATAEAVENLSSSHNSSDDESSNSYDVDDDDDGGGDDDDDDTDDDYDSGKDDDDADDDDDGGDDDDYDVLVNGLSADSSAKDGAATGAGDSGSCGGDGGIP